MNCFHRFKLYDLHCQTKSGVDGIGFLVVEEDSHGVAVGLDHLSGDTILSNLPQTPIEDDSRLRRSQRYHNTASTQILEGNRLSIFC